MDANATGRFIAERRRDKGYTQKDLADKLMVTNKAISRWETGKGFPDTSLLKPLSDILDVSVGELLAGKRFEDVKIKEQTDKIILESLNYAGRMLADTIGIILFIIGMVLIVSPLFLASKSYVWILGIAILIIAFFYVYIRKKGYAGKQSDKAYYLFAIVMQGMALVLELLPIGVVMVFAAGPNEYVVEICSYFSLLPLGYAHITPMLTGVLTIAAICFGIITWFHFDQSQICRKIAFICSIIALIFSFMPLL